MSLVLSVVIVLVLGLGLYIRVAPSDPARWHVDPTLAQIQPGEGRYLLRADGDAQSPVFAETPEVLMTRLAAIAAATPRTQVLAGTPEAAHMTFLTRSRLVGFPDYTSVKAIPTAEGGTVLVAYARLRFGRSDLGVNRARVEDWLAQLAGPAAGS